MAKLAKAITTKQHDLEIVKIRLRSRLRPGRGVSPMFVVPWGWSVVTPSIWQSKDHKFDRDVA